MFWIDRTEIREDVVMAREMTVINVDNSGMESAKSFKERKSRRSNERRVVCGFRCVCEDMNTKLIKDSIGFHLSFELHQVHSTMQWQSLR
jgi:hypothetical protein